MTAAVIRVGIADDHFVARLGLRRCLEASGDMVVVGEAHDGHEALALVQSQQVDVLLLDGVMPNASGLDVLPQLRAAAPATRIVLVSAWPSELFAGKALQLGAHAYLEKSATPDEIMAVIRDLAGASASGDGRSGGSGGKHPATPPTASATPPSGPPRS
jgi:DNA-binding NarL/FixJ family response regulator